MPNNGGYPDAFPQTPNDPFSKAQADAASILYAQNTPPDRGPGMPGPGVGMKNPAPQPGPVAGGPQRPPMPPPMPGQGGPGMTSGAGGAAVPFGPSTDYASALGIAPNGQDRMTSMMAGFGKGMTAGAGNKNSAGGAFMRGAGGAITGQINEAQEQQKLKLGLNNAYFNQTSTAFKDAMTQKSTDAKDLYWQSRAQQYLAQAKLNGGKAQPWNADQLALAKADNEGRADYHAAVESLKLRKGTMDDTEWNKRMDALEANQGQYIDRAYKRYGVDPQKAENIRTQGMTPEKPFGQVKTGDWYIDKTGKAIKKTANDNSYAPGDTVKWVNPFDTKGMDLTGFHQTVPNGAYYTTPAGLHQRTIPPPASPDPRQLQQSIQGAEQEENYTGGPQ